MFVKILPNVLKIKLFGRKKNGEKRGRVVAVPFFYSFFLFQPSFMDLTWPSASLRNKKPHIGKFFVFTKYAVISN